MQEEKYVFELMMHMLLQRHNWYLKKITQTTSFFRIGFIIIILIKLIEDYFEKFYYLYITTLVDESILPQRNITSFLTLFIITIFLTIVWTINRKNDLAQLYVIEKEITNFLKITSDSRNLSIWEDVFIRSKYDQYRYRTPYYLIEREPIIWFLLTTFIVAIQQFSL